MNGPGFPPQPMTQQQLNEEEMIGAIKIKDGLFIGDEFAAQDLEFVVANKVTHIINCAGKQVLNHWEQIGVVYLSYYWEDNDQQIMFDVKDQTTNQISDFIEDAINKTESVLVHSIRGQSRSSCVIAVYLMKKYRWSLLKTLEFLNSRRPDLEIRATFIHQLSGYENRLVKSGFGPKTNKWTEIADENQFLESDELLLRNTFMNAQMGPIAQFNPQLLQQNDLKQDKVKWLDVISNGQQMLASEGDPEQDLCLKTNIVKINNHRKVNNKQLRSSIKVNQCENQVYLQYPSQYYLQEEKPMINFYKQQSENLTQSENLSELNSNQKDQQALNNRQLIPTMNPQTNIENIDKQYQKQNMAYDLQGPGIQLQYQPLQFNYCNYINIQQPIQFQISQSKPNQNNNIPLDIEQNVIKKEDLKKAKVQKRGESPKIKLNNSNDNKVLESNQITQNRFNLNNNIQQQKIKSKSSGQPILKQGVGPINQSEQNSKLNSSQQMNFMREQQIQDLSDQKIMEQQQQINQSKQIKLNSFRNFGPIKAQHNYDYQQKQQQLQQNRYQLSQKAKIQSNQRPNSSKPIMKGSFNQESDQKSGVGPLYQIVSQQNVQQRPGTAGNRPQSPGTQKVKQNNQQERIKQPKRMRSSSPGSNQQKGQPNKSSNTQIKTNLNQPQYNQITNNYIGNKISQMIHHPQAKHGPSLYMRGYSPSKPKWKN